MSSTGGNAPSTPVAELRSAQTTQEKADKALALALSLEGKRKKSQVEKHFPRWFFHPNARLFTACWVIAADTVMVRP
jgi:hypothetical protein